MTTSTGGMTGHSGVGCSLSSPACDPRAGPVGEDLGRLIEFVRESFHRRFDAEFVAADEEKTTTGGEPPPRLAETLPGGCASLLEMNDGLGEELIRGLRPARDRLDPSLTRPQPIGP